LWIQKLKISFSNKWFFCFGKWNKNFYGQSEFWKFTVEKPQNSHISLCFFKCCWPTQSFPTHSKNNVADFTSAKTYSPRLSKSTKSKILLIWWLIVSFSRSGIAENVRLRFSVFMLKSVPSGRGFESRAVCWWCLTIYIDSTYQKRKICDIVFWVLEFYEFTTFPEKFQTFLEKVLQLDLFPVREKLKS
jgi:hypothetical protein